MLVENGLQLVADQDPFRLIAVCRVAVALGLRLGAGEYPVPLIAVVAVLVILAAGQIAPDQGVAVLAVLVAGAFRLAAGQDFLLPPAAGVVPVRGVSSDSSINSLVEKGLLREAGTADAPGNPMQYATTRVFLERFGLRSVDDLPDVAQFAPDEETRALIRERLSATSSASSSFARSDDAGEAGVTDGVSAGGSAGSHADAASDANTAEQMQRLADMQLSLLDEEEVVPPQMSSRDLLNAALSSSFGLVDKIDLSKLEFEDDDEF